jgi:ABC-type multidrug transport system ATPase subunit
MFTSRLRLTKLTEEERVIKVQSLISELGLESCKNDKMGKESIKGISGGQRKRTSIGVELLANPSLIFLEGPTFKILPFFSQQVTF